MKTQLSASVLIAGLVLTACADQSAVPTEVSTRLPVTAVASAAGGSLDGFGFNGAAGTVISQAAARLMLNRIQHRAQ
jgi:hypothetical protein